jgi:hypothetical protein
MSCGLISRRSQPPLALRLPSPPRVGGSALIVRLLTTHKYMLGFFIAPAILWIILFLIARHQGDTSYSTLFFVSLGITIVALVSSIYLPQFAIIVVPIVCVLAIQKFCNIGWLRSIIATVLYMVFLTAWSVLFDKVIH